MATIDLGLTITSAGSAYTGALRLAVDGRNVLLVPASPLQLEPAALAHAGRDPHGYGAALSAQLFGAPELRAAWEQARALHRGGQRLLRLRLRLDEGAPELHSLAWEALADPADGRPLAWEEESAVLRTVGPQAREPAALPTRPALRATIVAAGAPALARAPLGLDSIDIDGEVARARRAYGRLPLEIVGDHPDARRRAVSLAGLTAALGSAPSLLHLACHVRLDSGQPYIWMEHEGGAGWLPGSALADALAALRPGPLLIALSAGGGSHDSGLLMLGRQLSHSAPAVLALQGDDNQRTARRLLPPLIADVRRDGAIDRALARARAGLRDGDDWWRPVLWLANDDGRLWQGGPAAPALGLPGKARRAGPPQPAPDLSELPKLREALTASFSDSELRQLCHDLSIDYESLGGEGKSGKALQLVEYLQRRNQVDRLIDLVLKLRPQIAHPKAPLAPAGALRQKSAALAFELQRAQPDWRRVEELAEQVLRLEPENSLADDALADARDQLERLEMYTFLSQQRDSPSTGWEDIARGFAELERGWPDLPDSDGLRDWIDEQRRLARLGAARLRLFGQQNPHGSLDELEALLVDSAPDPDVAALAAQIVELPAASFDHRLRAADLLGRAGDPRLPQSRQQWEAATQERSYTFGSQRGYWCYVPFGVFSIGAWHNGRFGSALSLESYWIARYPLTVAQYRGFVEAGGYNEERWWRPHGWALRQRGVIQERPWGWDNPRLTRPNQPVVGVTWDEASAFCAWLSHELGATSRGYAVRLPSEAEWEAAAFFDRERQARAFPWGDAPPTIDQAIWSDGSTHYRRNAPAPVGCCPAGAAPCGAHDMAGNVWELMASSWERYPDGSADPAEPTQGEHIAWRGGAWPLAGVALNRSVRDQSRRDGHNFDQGGFRIVLARSLRLL